MKPDKKQVFLIVFAIAVLIFSVALWFISCCPEGKGISVTSEETLQEETLQEQFRFVALADMREFAGESYDTEEYLRGTVEKINEIGSFAFILIPGDLDPPDAVYWTIRKYLGADVTVYPVVGNHEAETPEDMIWLRNYNYDQKPGEAPDIVNVGPSACEKTTFSYDYKNTHFVILNQYCDDLGDNTTDGRIGDLLYSWLESDLEQNQKEMVIIIGHEPAYPLADMSTGRIRHIGDSLDQYPLERDRFWNLLTEHDVELYICGHTHDYSAVQINGVWQIDVAHSRGIGDPEVPSTFVVFDVVGEVINASVYRSDTEGKNYTVVDTIEIK